MNCSYSDSVMFVVALSIEHGLLDTNQLLCDESERVNLSMHTIWVYTSSNVLNIKLQSLQEQKAQTYIYKFI